MTLSRYSETTPAIRYCRTSHGLLGKAHVADPFRPGKTLCGHRIGAFFVVFPEDGRMLCVRCENYMKAKGWRA